jgi:glutamine amidotransferase
MNIVVVDYNAGNLRSIETALRFLKADFFISNDPLKILKADRLIFPGVGEAKAAMQVLQATHLAEAISDFFKSGRPLLGICLGSAIILDKSEESNTKFLGLIPGLAKLFPRKPGYKVPHMGWNQVFQKQDCQLFRDIPVGTSFYFVHSYYPEPRDKKMRIAETDYIVNFSSGLKMNNLVAVQFHPEKSGKYGLKLLQNFLEWRP